MGGDNCRQKSHKTLVSRHGRDVVLHQIIINDERDKDTQNYKCKCKSTNTNTRLHCRDVEEMWYYLHFIIVKETMTELHSWTLSPIKNTNAIANVRQKHTQIQIQIPLVPRFDLMLSYGELGPFLSVFSILSLILYFVTRSGRCSYKNIQKYIK